MRATEIKTCHNPRCYHEWQDKEYDGKRVHNRMANGKYRCTVCKTVRD